jgi:hypothetical protein
MIARRVKLRLNVSQTAQLEAYYATGTGVWNWALSQYLAEEVHWRRGSRLTPVPAWAPGASHPDWLQAHYGSALPVSTYGLYAALNGVAQRIDVPNTLLRGLVDDVVRAWGDYRSGVKGRPRRKGMKNRLSSLPFKAGVRLVDPTHVYLPSIGSLRLHAQNDLPGLCGLGTDRNRIKQARLQQLPRGWYLTLFLDAAPRPIPLTDDRVAGVDLGYSTLVTLSTGEKFPHPKEYQRLEHRLGQVARGQNRRLLGALQQRLANARRHRNHDISRQMVGTHAVLYISRDNLKGLQRTMGKSVLSAGHGQLLTMIASKSRQAGRIAEEVSNFNSTRTCSHCGALTGPRGKAGLSVRDWDCGTCGVHHDRDVNAALNTLRTGGVSAPRARVRARS